MNIKFVIMSQCDVASGLNNCRSLLPTFSSPSNFAICLELYLMDEHHTL